jgi:hypothetical protein
MEKSTVMLSARVWGWQYDGCVVLWSVPIIYSTAVQVRLESDMDDRIDACGALKAG